MRIAMISFHTCPLASQEGKETGGMNVYVLELSRRLVQLGHEVDMFTRCQDPSNQKVVPVEPGLRLMHLFAGPPHGVPKKELPQYLDEFVERMAAFMEEEGRGYDVWHGHYYLSGLIAVKLATVVSRPAPLVMTFHTLALMKNLVARTQQEQEDRLRIEAEYALVQQADRIITPSPSDRAYVHYLYEADPGKLKVIPPGVNTSVFKPIDQAVAKQQIGADAGTKLVLFVGRIEPLKGIDAIMYALKIVTQRQPDINVQLWIVGGDVSQTTDQWSAELKKLERLRRCLKIPKVVHFVGQKPQDELVAYYNAAEVVVMPSHYESFGMAAVEAMACGVPVITTNVTGVSGLIDEVPGALMTSVNNPLHLATQIQQVLSPTEQLAEVKADLLSKAQQLDWGNIAERVSDTYREVCK